MNRIVCALLLGLLACFAPKFAHAQSCSVSTTEVAFGVYDPAAPAPNDKNGAVTATCVTASNVNVTIQLDRGANSPALPNRRMRTGTTNYMSYNLYTTVARNVIWGDGTGGTQTIARRTGADSGGCTGDRVLIWSWITCPVYGRIPINQDVAIGTYSDQVTVTVIF
jgi:spore coat protein U-like protein